MSKEEILEKHRKDTFYAPWVLLESQVLPAMDEYAEKRAIQFGSYISTEMINFQKETPDIEQLYWEFKINKP